jgi:hypothetical protein
VQGPGNGDEENVHKGGQDPKCTAVPARRRQFCNMAFCVYPSIMDT